MALHLLRMAVKIESIAHLKQVQAERLREEQRNGGKFLYTFTRNIPKRVDELLDGGSLFWVIKRYIRVRQPILGLERLQNRTPRLPTCQNSQNRAADKIADPVSRLKLP